MNVIAFLGTRQGQIAAFIGIIAGISLCIGIIAPAFDLSRVTTILAGSGAVLSAVGMLLYFRYLCTTKDLSK